MSEDSGVSQMSHANREQWLMSAVDHLVPLFERSGYSVPIVKVSVGFPSTGANGRHLGLNCCQFRSTTKESFSIVNHCSNMG